MTIPATAASSCIGAWVVGRLLAEIVHVIETTGPSAKTASVSSRDWARTGGLALYQRSGFRTVGVYREQGQLDGRWVDTIVMERLL